MRYVKWETLGLCYDLDVVHSKFMNLLKVKKLKLILNPN